jgi:hypothetical protein
VLKRKVYFQMKECLKTFAVNSLKTVNPNYLEKFISIVQENAMEEVLDKSFLVYIQAWVEEIFVSEFNPNEIGSNMMRQVFRMVGLMAENKCLEIDSNSILIIEMVMDVMNEIKTRKLNIKTIYYQVFEYVCRSLYSYSAREFKEENICQKIWDNSTFIRSLVSELMVRRP